MRLLLPISVICWGCNPIGDCAQKSAAPQGGDPVALSTEDGICLVGDYYVASSGNPGVVLLHMTPTSWDRKSWSIDFVRRVHAEQWHVLNLDRRGAGDSDGEPEDAFNGDGGRKDVDAAVSFLVEQGASSISLISASNGSTSALDYAVWARDNARVEPVSLVMMSGGSYTENQNSISRLAEMETPTLFQADDEDGLWFEENFDALNPGDWDYIEYPGAGHGSQMLDETPEVGDDILDFVGEHWPDLTLPG